MIWIISPGLFKYHTIFGKMPREFDICSIGMQPGGRPLYEGDARPAL